ncbi:hypothetical protein D3C81_2254460 [compost metagenome]
MPTISDALLEPVEPNDMGLLSINRCDKSLAVTRQVVKAIDLGIKFVNDTLLLPNFFDDHLQLF